MQELMKFEDVSELLKLDARDEKRNRILLGAVFESISLYLDRNLLLDMKTERIASLEGAILPHEYPIREIVILVDVLTGDSVSLTDVPALKDLLRPDAHRQTRLLIEGKIDREVRITYRYGYELNEMPQLIREAVLSMMTDRLNWYGKPSDEESTTVEKARLGCISIFRRNPLL